MRDICFIKFDGVEEILKAAFTPDMAHETSFRNVIGIGQTAYAVVG